MMNALGVILSFIAKLFGAWVQVKEDNKVKVDFGEAQQRNKAHEQNAKGKAAADEIMREDLPLGEDLIDALKDDAGIDDTDTDQ